MRQELNTRLRHPLAVLQRELLPQGYLDILAGMGIPERRRPFYAHWVRKFLRQQPGRNRLEPCWADVESFLDNLGKQEGAEDWQVAQAREALKIFCMRFTNNSISAEKKTKEDAVEVEPAASAPKSRIAQEPSLKFHRLPGEPGIENQPGWKPKFVPQPPAPSHPDSPSRVSSEKVVRVD